MADYNCITDNSNTTPIFKMHTICENFCENNWEAVKKRANNYQARRGSPLIQRFTRISDISPADLVITDFNFTLESSCKPSIIAFEEVIENPSKYVATEVNFQRSAQVENSFSFSFNESILLGASVTIKAKPPFAEASATINTEVSFGSSQEVSKKEIKSWEFSNKFIIEAGHSVNLKCIITQEAVEALYTAKLMFGPRVWIGLYNIDIKATSWIPVKELFTEKEIANDLAIPLSGHFEGADAIKGIVRIEDIGGDCSNTVICKEL